jgi:hypothetical protein
VPRRFVLETGNGCLHHVGVFFLAVLQLVSHSQNRLRLIGLQD